MILKTKICSKCKELKSINEFNWRRDNNKYRNECKKCRNLLCKKWRKNNPEKAREINRRWQKINREKENERSRKYRKNNSKKTRRATQKWRENNPEYHKEYYKNNPEYRLSHKILVAMGGSLKREKNGKYWEYLVGYNLIDLITHLEGLFQIGMSWDNYGKGGWEIDHKKPISSFNFNSYEDPEFKECWALENLQPLWAKENLSKGNKIK